MENTLIIDIGVITTYVLLGLAAFGVFVSAIRSLVANPKGLKMALIGFVGVGIVVAAAFGLSSGSDVSEVLLEKTGTAHWWVRPVGAGLFAFYILLASTIVLLIATEVMRPFKK